MAKINQYLTSLYVPLSGVAILALAGALGGLIVGHYGLRTKIREQANETLELRGRLEDAYRYLSKYGRLIGTDFWPYIEGETLDIESVTIIDDGSFIKHPYKSNTLSDDIITKSDSIDVGVVSLETTPIPDIYMCRNGSFVDYSDKAEIQHGIDMDIDVKGGKVIAKVGVEGLMLRDIPLLMGDNRLSFHFRDAEGGQEHTQDFIVTSLLDSQHAKYYLGRLEDHLQLHDPNGYDKHGEQGRKRAAMKKIGKLFDE